MKKILALLALLSLPCLPARAALHIVAAENFYGGVAQQIAGNDATVMSILTNPHQDPHEFTTTAETAWAVAEADIVIYSGIGYDSWMDKLLATRGKPGRVVINVAALVGAKNGDNPHIWYSPKIMVAFAHELAEALANANPSRLATYQANFESFKTSMKSVLDKITEIKGASNGMEVTATEPVFGYMAEALGLKMLNSGFQVKIMNDTEPSADEMAAFEKSLATKRVKILFYNSQVADPTTERLQNLAKAAGICVVGVTETQPPGTRNYADWMMQELNKVQAALSAKSK